MKHIRKPLLSRILFLAGISLLIFSFTLSAFYDTALATEAALEEPVSGLHPDFALLDTQGENVLDTGEPVSTMETCGVCHDTGFILEHSFHADAGLSDFALPGSFEVGHDWDTSPGSFGKWNPIEYRYLSPETDTRIDLTTPEWLMKYGAGHVGGGPASTSRSGIGLTELTPGTTVESQWTDPVNGELIAWDWSESGVVEMNCFLCHIGNPDLKARSEALEEGNFGWANTATLLNTGIVQATGGGFEYVAAVFGSDKTLAIESIALQDPTNTNCGACHGLVHTNNDIPLTYDGISAWRTSTTGQIISPQRISNSGLNLAQKDTLMRSWDAHAEHVVGCTDCHFSLNNPIYTDVSPSDDLAHLVFDPRRIDFGAYLQRPVHDFARGPNSQDTIAPELTGTMRRCESCHDSSVSHDWLPYADRHMSAMSCETCHIPKMFAPAYEEVDWTVLTVIGEPRITYRGIEDPDAALPLLTGFEPVLLPSTDVDNQTRLAPFNLVSVWYWIYGSDESVRPVREQDLQSAWLSEGKYADEVLTLFDANEDGQLDATELIINTTAKEGLIAGRLNALGLDNPRIAGEVQPYGIHHDVATGEWSTRECASCHGEESRITAPVMISGSAPGGVIPTIVDTPNVGSTGEFFTDDAGRLLFAPVTAEQGLYIIGHDSVGWIDGFGIVAFIGVLLGVTTHGGLRYFAARKRVGEVEEHEIREVYMYSVYERLWHWLQTGAILLLLFTGLIIHKPDTFGIFSFSYVVLVHNVLAGILVVNAALSLFYHLVSGEIQQYLPRPRGFFDDAIVQAKYYTKGIFKGDLHPFDKTPKKKLNPLQQVTYFGILNVLLPLQIITGALMWGAQRWPNLANSLGGLPFLGPFHSLVAWMFATFIVAHVYLTTTGPYPTAAIKAMMVGWDEVEVHAEAVSAPEAGAAD